MFGVKECVQFYSASAFLTFLLLTILVNLTTVLNTGTDCGCNTDFVLFTKLFYEIFKWGLLIFTLKTFLRFVNTVSEVLTLTNVL